MSADPMANRAPNLARYCDADFGGARRKLPLDVLLAAAHEAVAEGVFILSNAVIRDAVAGYPEIADDPEKYGLVRNA